MGNSRSSPAPPPPPPPPPPPVAVPSVTGRYIRINRSDTATDAALNIAEIEVYDGYGAKITSGITPTLSPLYNNDSNSFGPQMLIDGNMSNFAHTENVKGAYMQLDLGSDKQISRVVITNRADCCQGRIVGASFQIKNTADVIVFNATINSSKAAYDIPTTAATSSPLDVPGYTAYANKDSNGNDIKSLPFGAPLNDIAAACNQDSNCKGFNSGGWIKSSLRPQAEWAPVTINGKNIDLYVKNPPPAAAAAPTPAPAAPAPPVPAATPPAPVAPGSPAVPAPAPSGPELKDNWMCIADMSAPVKRFGNDVGCLTLDGKTCMYGYCNDPNSKFPANPQSLVCGDDYKSKLGFTGYESPETWCSKANRVLPGGKPSNLTADAAQLKAPAPPPAPASMFTEMGSGICLTSSGTYPAYEQRQISEAECVTLCQDDDDCMGYAISSDGNCQIYNTSTATVPRTAKNGETLDKTDGNAGWKCKVKMPKVAVSVPFETSTPLSGPPVAPTVSSPQFQDTRRPQQAQYPPQQPQQAQYPPQQPQQVQYQPQQVQYQPQQQYQFQPNAPMVGSLASAVYGAALGRCEAALADQMTKPYANMTCSRYFKGGAQLGGAFTSKPPKDDRKAIQHHRDFPLLMNKCQSKEFCDQNQIRYHPQFNATMNKYAVKDTKGKYIPYPKCDDRSKDLDRAKTVIKKQQIALRQCINKPIQRHREYNETMTRYATIVGVKDGKPVYAPCGAK